MFKCDKCSKVCKSERGLAMHKFACDSDEGGINDIDEVIPSNIDKAISVLQDQRKKRMLTALEENNLLTVKLENKKMQDELTGNTPAQTQPEQRSELDTFSKFVEMQEKMSSSLATREENLKNRIREEIENDVSGEDSMETRLAFEALGLLKAKMAAGQLPANPVSSGIPVPIDQTKLTEVKKKPMKTEEEILQEKIRSGELKFPEAKKLFKKKYPKIKMSEAQLKKEFERIKNGN